MPARDEAPAGGPIWVDLMTSDADRARAFYAKVFGWAAEDPNPDFGGYVNFTLRGVRIAGCMQSMGEDIPDAWSVYLRTDDAAGTVDAAAREGAQVIVPATEVGDLGTMAVVVDPGGASIGMWQPAAHRGSGIVTEAGAPSWFELQTRDYGTSVAFYEKVFGWTTRPESDTPEFRYTVFERGDDQYAGIMDASGFLPEGVPSQWSVYFGTDDTDGTLAEIQSLGGAVVMPAEDTPYGRLAAASDPTGAVFKLVAPNEMMPARD
jgi:predicted enzyme related to lactoylglutathione lyase